MPDSFAFALASLAIHVVGAVPYVRGILKKDVVPHPFSYLTWFVLSLVNFAVLWKSDANWTLVPALAHIVFAAYYVYAGFAAMGRLKPTSFDAWCLAISLIVLPVSFTPAYGYATLVAIFVDAVAFLPTIRKTWKDPSTEYAFPWFVAALYPFTLYLAIGTPSWENASFWLYSGTVNAMFTVMILKRRKNVASEDAVPFEKTADA